MRQTRCTAGAQRRKTSASWQWTIQFLGQKALFLALGTLLLLGQCAPSRSTPTPPSTATSDLGAHLLVRVTGDLGYKHPGWKEYLPLSFGLALRRGDLVRVAPDAEGLVVCADLSLAPLPSGYQGGLPCTQARPILTRGESLVVAPQRDMPPAAPVPYILSPRHTFLRDGTPLLRWAPTGAAGYTVHLWGGEVDWTAQTTAAELRYGADAPPLQPGVAYHLSVTDADGHSSDQEGTALDLSFALLSPEQVAAVEALLAQAQDLELDEQATCLLEAEIYAAHGLRAEAITLLADLTAAKDAPTLHRRLGDLYLEVGLYTEAQAAFEQALSGYRVVGDRAGQAAALAGLGLAQRGNRDEAAARDSFSQARDLYQALGDAEGAGQVEKLLAELGNK